MPSLGTRLPRCGDCYFRMLGSAARVQTRSTSDFSSHKVSYISQLGCTTPSSCTSCLWPVLTPLHMTAEGTSPLITFARPQQHHSQQLQQWSCRPPLLTPRLQSPASNAPRRSVSSSTTVRRRSRVPTEISSSWSKLHFMTLAAPFPLLSIFSACNVERSAFVML